MRRCAEDGLQGILEVEVVEVGAGYIYTLEKGRGGCQEGEFHDGGGSDIRSAEIKV